MYYLENTTFGFSPDKCLFDTHDDALEYLRKIVDVNDLEENRRILEAWGRSECHNRWEITPVYDWERRLLGRPRVYIEARREGCVELEEEVSDMDSVVQYLNDKKTDEVDFLDLVRAGDPIATMLWDLA